MLNMNCVRATETTEPNPLIATLDVFQEEAVCLCYVPDLEVVSRDSFVASVSCGLQVTRCVSPVKISATISRSDVL